MRYEPDVSSGATEGSLATLCALCTCGCFLLSRWRISASIVLLIISFSRSADNYPSASGNPNLYALSWSLFTTAKYTFHFLFLWIFIATSATAVALLRNRFFRVNDSKAAFILYELVMRSVDNAKDPAFSLETFHDLRWISLYKSYCINLP